MFGHRIVRPSFRLGDHHRYRLQPGPMLTNPSKQTVTAHHAPVRFQLLAIVPHLNSAALGYSLIWKGAVGQTEDCHIPSGSVVTASKSSAIGLAISVVEGWAYSGSVPMNLVDAAKCRLEAFEVSDQVSIMLIRANRLVINRLRLAAPVPVPELLTPPGRWQFASGQVAHTPDHRTQSEVPDVLI